jgi:hypothetical protein
MEHFQASCRNRNRDLGVESAESTSAKMNAPTRSPSVEDNKQTDIGMASTRSATNMPETALLTKIYSLNASYSIKN